MIHINAHVIFPHRVGQRTLLEKPFAKLGLDVFGQIKLVGQCTRNWYIFVVINYATKWVEIKALKNKLLQPLNFFSLSIFVCDLIVQ